jgi:hypothetical protein
MNANYNLIKDYFNKNIDDNLEFEIDLNKSKDINYIDFDIYADILKYLNLLGKKNNFEIQKYDILDINYNFKLNNNLEDTEIKQLTHRISIINSEDKTIDFYLKKYENKKNSDIFKILSKLSLNKNSNTKNLDYYVKKQKVENYDFDDYNIRIRCRQETKPDFVPEDDIDDNDIFLRRKNRLSLFLNKDLRIDITEVKTYKNFKKVLNNDYIKQTYELEFEYFVKDKKINKIDEYLPIMISKINVLLKMINVTNFLIPLQEEEKIIENLNKLMKITDNETKNFNAQNKKFTLPNAVVITFERSHLKKVINKYMTSFKIDGIRGFIFISETKVYVLLSNNKIIFTGLIVDKKYNNTIFDGEYVYNSKYGKFIFMVFDSLFISGEDLRNDSRVVNRISRAITVINDCFIDKESDFNCFDYNNKITNQEELIKLYKKQISNSNKSILKDLLRYKNKKINTVMIRPSQYLVVKGCNDNEIYKYADLMWNYYKNNIAEFPYGIDGIIFQPSSWSYISGGKQINKIFNNPVLKWKPKERNTIDFYIEFKKNPETNDIYYVTDNDETNDDDEIIENKPYCICNLYVSRKIENSQKPVLFEPQLKNPNKDKHIAYLPLNDNNLVTDQDNDIINDKTIVEFYYDKDKITTNDYFRWIPVKIRNDKTVIMRTQQIKYGNAEIISYKNWSSMMYPITDNDLKKLANDKLYGNEIERLDKSIMYLEYIDNIKNTEEKYEVTKNNSIINNTLRYVKQFNNIVKTLLINTYNSNKLDNKKKNIIDIGIGNGVDIYKYYDAEVNSMVCLDNNYNNFTDPNGVLPRYKKASSSLPNFPKTTFVNADVTISFNENDQRNFIQNISEENIKTMKECFNKKYHVVNILNTMEYLLKDEESFNNLCNNLNKITENNSIVIITTHDAKLINEKFKDKEEYNIDIYKNNENINLYSIQKRYDEKQEIFRPGSLIEIKDEVISEDYYNEYLVDEKFLVPEFEKRCNLTLLETDTYNNIYENIKKYILMSSEIDSNLKTRNFFNDKIKGFYDNTEENEKCKDILFLNRYYVFTKKIDEIVKNPKKK